MSPARTPASASPRGASAGTPSSARYPRSRADEGIQTPGLAGSPSHLPGPVPASPEDRGRAVPGTEAGSGTAGGTRDAASRPLPAGGRTYTIEMPAGLKLLSLNGREHWAEKARRTETLKKAAWAMALAAKIPPLERASIAAEYQPPDRRRRDADNPAPSVKACVDGIVAAGVLVDDECPRYVTGISCAIGPVYPKGRLILRLTEVMT